MEKAKPGRVWESLCKAVYREVLGEGLVVCVDASKTRKDMELARSQELGSMRGVDTAPTTPPKGGAEQSALRDIHLGECQQEVASASSTKRGRCRWRGWGVTGLLSLSLCCCFFATVLIGASGEPWVLEEVTGKMNADAQQ